MAWKHTHPSAWLPETEAKRARSRDFRDVPSFSDRAVLWDIQFFSFEKQVSGRMSIHRTGVLTL